MNAFCIFMHPKRALLLIERLESDLFAEKETNRTVILSQRQALMKARERLEEKETQISLLEGQIKELQAQYEERLRGKESVTFHEIVDEWLNGKEDEGG